MIGTVPLNHKSSTFGLKYLFGSDMSWSWMYPQSLSRGNLSAVALESNCTEAWIKIRGGILQNTFFFEESKLFIPDMTQICLKKFHYDHLILVHLRFHFDGIGVGFYCCVCVSVLYILEMVNYIKHIKCEGNIVFLYYTNRHSYAQSLTNGKAWILEIIQSAVC